METISNMISHDLDIYEYFKGSNSCFIDIETTGLSRKKNMIYLIGLLYFDPKSNSWILNQYFASSMDKEETLLRQFIKDISIFDTIITYNGDSFDIPFINHKLSYYNIKNLIDRSKSFDLYRIIKSNRQYLNLKNLKLKTIEESLGFFRQDIYSGFDCIQFYYDYIKSNDQSLKNNILEHNYDDLVHMLDIIIILDIINDKKSFQIHFDNSIKTFKICNIQIIGDMINISGNIGSPLKRDIKNYQSNYSIITKNLNEFEINFEFREGYITEKEKCMYIDTLDYHNIKLKNHIDYNLPSNIFLLMIEKDICIDNIKNLIKNLFENLINCK